MPSQVFTHHRFVYVGGGGTKIQCKSLSLGTSPLCQIFRNKFSFSLSLSLSLSLHTPFFFCMSKKFPLPILSLSLSPLSLLSLPLVLRASLQLSTFAVAKGTKHAAKAKRSVPRLEKTNRTEGITIFGLNHELFIFAIFSIAKRVHKPCHSVFAGCLPYSPFTQFRLLLLSLCVSFINGPTFSANCYRYTLLLLTGLASTFAPNSPIWGGERMHS